ncbi:hypothetical protein E6Q11_04275 [Candidatus Dojkabacteria bacterium]|uniref:Uncharacterized protein n=1 Tax=Candidatus Dojkabacteria bacterium TaxID=2099670 RepID=A0A5C7J5J9_9BACT|nr:MAG: hypothetical protein E6Q11_04275 [Candidatus Dojkabacteria bacterium]
MSLQSKERHLKMIRLAQDAIEELEPLVDKYSQYLNDWEAVSMHDNLDDIEKKVIEAKRKECSQRYGHWLTELMVKQEELQSLLGIGRTKSDTEEPYDLGQE